MLVLLQALKSCDIILQSLHTYTHCHSDEGDRGRWSWQTGGSHWSCLHGQQLLLSTQVTFPCSSLPPSLSPSSPYHLQSPQMCQLLLQERWPSCSDWTTKGFYYSGKLCVNIFYLPCVPHCFLIEQQPSYSVPVRQKLELHSVQEFCCELCRSPST